MIGRRCLGMKHETLNFSGIVKRHDQPAGVGTLEEHFIVIIIRAEEPLMIRMK